MDNTMGFGQQACLVMDTRKIVLESQILIAAIEKRMGCLELRARHRAYLDPQLVEEDCTSDAREFAGLNKAKFDVEKRLEEHEATLCGQIRRLVEIRDALALAAQAGQINQSQQAAPAPMPVPQATISVPTPAGQPQLPPGYRTWQKRYACSVCWAQGNHQDWDRTTAVDKHAMRVHGHLVDYQYAPSRPRR